MMQQTSLQNEHVMAAEWDKADNLQELDLTATDLSKECLMDILPKIPAIRWLSVGQLDGLNDSVFKVIVRLAKPNSRSFMVPMNYSSTGWITRT